MSAFIFLYRVLRLGDTVQVASQDLLRVWQPDAVWSGFIARMLQKKSAA